jgi:hypothetical protein
MVSKMPKIRQIEEVRTSSKRVMLILPTLITPKSVFCGFVRSKVDCVRRTCAVLVSPDASCQLCRGSCGYQPAPSTTLDSPRHSVLKPSTLDMVIMALEMPEYTAVGEGLTTCIRVWNWRQR